jgi:hypothetical protein
MTKETLMDETLANDYDQLKVEVASNAGLMLKDFTEPPEEKIKHSSPVSFLTELSEDNQKKQLVNL